MLALQILLLLTIVKQRGLLTVNGFTSLLTLLLTLRAFYLLILVEHTALTPFRMSIFRAAHCSWMGGEEGASLPKICHIYPHVS